ncbi:hypothetical protein PVAP13_8KG256200 [Panicum virgatum]|uniref:Uncharacterized protein n=2 Tax=Panicum virgatum TaxID=38727 RepID=A0A8T0PN24_PANVG|nr:hypothetical protein PVAP13_8KG256200 [Panicum virgatum]
MISGPLPHQATSVATITAGQQPGLPIARLINRIGRNRATELSLTITAEDNSQLPLGTTEQVEETAGFTAPVMFQPPSLEMTIPLVDTFLALSVQIPFSYIPVEKCCCVPSWTLPGESMPVPSKILCKLLNQGSFVDCRIACSNG